MHAYIYININFDIFYTDTNRNILIYTHIYFLYVCIYIYVYIMYIYVHTQWGICLNKQTVHTLYTRHHTKHTQYCIHSICSEHSCYNKCCNELEVWLREQSYSDKLVRQKTLKVRKLKRKNLLNDVKDKRNDYKLVFNITYHPNLSNLKDNMPFLHLLLTPNQEHQKVFDKVFIFGFRQVKKSLRL